MGFSFPQFIIELTMITAHSIQAAASNGQPAKLDDQTKWLASPSQIQLSRQHPNVRWAQ